MLPKAQPVSYNYDKIVIIMTIIAIVGHNCYYAKFESKLLLKVSPFVTIGFRNINCYSFFDLLVTCVIVNCYNIS